MGQDWIRPAASNGFKPYAPPRADGEIRYAPANISSPLKKSFTASPGGSGISGAAATSALDFLSDELIFNILRHLYAEELSKISKVAKRLYYLSIDYRLWKPLYFLHFSYHKHELKDTDTNYYDYFRECWRKETGDVEKTTITEKLLKLVAKSRREETFACDWTSGGKSRDLKVLFLGQSGTGKSALVSAIFGSGFDLACPPTMGASFVSKKILIGKLMVKLSCWDISGGERYTQMVPLYFKDVSVVLTVYSVAQKESVARMKTWIKDLRQPTHASLGLAVYVIGTKCDLRRAVPKNEVEDWCREQQLPHFEVSSKTGAGVHDLIETIVCQYRQRNKLPEQML